MAQLMRLSLCLAILLQPTVGEDDQSCILQSQKGSPSGKLVEVKDAVSAIECAPDEEAYEFDFTPGPGRELTANQPIVPGGPVTYVSLDANNQNRCIGVGIWNAAANGGIPGADPDLLGCPGDGSQPNCNLLVVLEDQSDLDPPNIVIDDCGSGPNIVRLQLNPPQKVLNFKFWDNDEGDSSFRYTNVDTSTKSVTIPDTANNAGTSVDISGESPAPENVEFIDITFGGSGGFQSLTLCRKRGSDVIGDPHIHTFEGQRYLVLNQGNFDLWHISGLHTNFMAQNLMKKVDINWQFYTHYSGSKSFTKGLLLVDTSGGKTRQMAELTSKDCKWRTKMPGGQWEVVKESKLFSVPDGETFVTGTHLNLEGQHLTMSMNTEQGKTDVAGLFWSCRPGHHINLRMQMMRAGANDEQYVHGEVRGLSQRTVKPEQSMLQAASSTEMQMSDDEFSVKRSWQQLGGSDAAGRYFEALDAPGPISQLQAICSSAEKEEAAKICTKYLSEDGDAEFFQDCVMDVCNGAGEVAAELTAELRKVSRKA